MRKRKEGNSSADAIVLGSCLAAFPSERHTQGCVHLTVP